MTAQTLNVFFDRKIQQNVTFGIQTVWFNKSLPKLVRATTIASFPGYFVSGLAVSQVFFLFTCLARQVCCNQWRHVPAEAHLLRAETIIQEV